MTLSIPSVQDLMAPMQFAQEDIEANRGGTLGPNQRIRLENLQRQTILIGVLSFMGIGIVASVFLYFGQIKDSTILVFIGAMLTIINAILIGFLGRHWMQLSGDIRNDEVVTISGMLERVLQPDGKMNNFILRVEGETFHVNKDLFKLFRHEVEYRLYYAPYSRVLLAAEPTT